MAFPVGVTTWQFFIFNVFCRTFLNTFLSVFIWLMFYRCDGHSTIFKFKWNWRKWGIHFLEAFRLALFQRFVRNRVKKKKWVTYIRDAVDEKCPSWLVKRATNRGAETNVRFTIKPNLSKKKEFVYGLKIAHKFPLLLLIALFTFFV